jgi:hypothetical protein
VPENLTWQRKQFFFEKRTKKLLILGGASPERLRPNEQKFLVLFFKKGDFSFALESEFSRRQGR